MMQAGITRAEVVKRDAHVDIAQRLEHRPRLVQTHHDSGLGDLGRQAMGWEVRSDQGG